MVPRFQFHGVWVARMGSGRSICLRFEAAVTGVPERFRDGGGNMKSVW